MFIVFLVLELFSHVKLPMFLFSTKHFGMSPGHDESQTKVLCLGKVSTSRATGHRQEQSCQGGIFPYFLGFSRFFFGHLYNWQRNMFFFVCVGGRAQVESDVFFQFVSIFFGGCGVEAPQFRQKRVKDMKVKCWHPQSVEQG